MKTVLIFFAVICSAYGNLKSPRPPGFTTPFTENFKSRASLQAGDVVEGDIMLDNRNAALYRGERNAMKNVNLWPKGVVPYILDSSVDDHLASQIAEGIKEYDKYTCLRFVKRTTEKDYIRVMKPASGCNSMVGAVGGEQILNMGDGCQYVGLVLHEFGHAIGYYHEHNRPDRDDTVEIMWDNIVYGFKDAFYKYTWDEADVQGFKYDLTSIMHYENSAFTNGYCRPTMLVKNDYSYEVTPVYLRKFSPQDIQKINKLYNCQTTQLPPTVLPGSGNPDPSQCKCEDKFNDCQSWANSGECGLNLNWMSTNCPKSCRTCGEPPSDCADLYPVACESWGQGGECQKNPLWMKEHCKRTCYQCPGQSTPPPYTGPTTQPVCQDNHASCPNWASSGECGLNLEWMSANCAKSCRTCGEPPSDCKDLYPVACETWGQSGECDKNPGWMNTNCEKTCKQCTGGATKPPVPGSTEAPTPRPPTQPPQPTTQPTGDCKDVYPEYCPEYRNNGWCHDANYQDYMKKVCFKTCGYCGGGGNCLDVYPQYCPGYKESGMCTDPNYLDYVKEVCKYTCGFCS